MADECGYLLTELDFDLSYLRESQSETNLFLVLKILLFLNWRLWMHFYPVPINCFA